MRCPVLTLLFCLLPLLCPAADMQVLSFAAGTDIDARINPVRDNRGELCALVKVEIPLHEVQFEGSMVMRQEYHEGEYWVWLPRQAREFTIKHPHLAPLSYAFAERLAAGTSYHLRLEVPEALVRMDYRASVTDESGSRIWLTALYGWDAAALHSWGAQLGQQFGAWGWMVAFRSNYRFGRAGLTAQEDGRVDGVRPFYDGSLRSEVLTAYAALTYDVLARKYPQSMLSVYAGAGYGHLLRQWGTYDGQWVLQQDISQRSAVAALGLTGGWRGFTASLGVATTGFRTVAIEVSVGYAWRMRGAGFAGRP